MVLKNTSIPFIHTSFSSSLNILRLSVVIAILSDSRHHSSGISLGGRLLPLPFMQIKAKDIIKEKLKRGLNDLLDKFIILALAFFFLFLYIFFFNLFIFIFIF